MLYLKNLIADNNKLMNKVIPMNFMIPTSDMYFTSPLWSFHNKEIRLSANAT